jgi:hypothetical protein
VTFLLAFLGCLFGHLTIIQAMSTLRGVQRTRRIKQIAKRVADAKALGKTPEGGHLFVRDEDMAHEACVECGLHRQQYEHEQRLELEARRRNQILERVEIALNRQTTISAISALGAAVGGPLVGAARERPAAPAQPAPSPADGVPQ